MLVGLANPEVGTTWSGSWKGKTSGTYAARIFDHGRMTVGGESLEELRPVVTAFLRAWAKAAEAAKVDREAVAAVPDLWTTTGQHHGRVLVAACPDVGDRLAVFYDYESDLGNGWEDQRVHNDPEEKRQQALQMGANILTYCFTNSF